MSFTEETPPTPPPVLPRRQDYIPVLYVSGSHYEIGHTMGRVYGNMLKQFVAAYEPLKDYLKAFADPKGRKIYDEALAQSRRYFPQYIIEMEGIADGSSVPFEQLFLMTLDDTLPVNLEKGKGPVGCTSILVNQPSLKALGHTEDALTETVNNFILLCAHIIPSDREKGGIFEAREEKFKAITYIGHLSGYASGFNYHGVIFSINTLFVSNPLPNKIPREIITRALLGARADMKEIMSIVLNEGCGTADGFNVNVAFLNEPSEQFVTHTIEVVPDPGNSSAIALNSFPVGQNSLHTNRMLHIKYPELHEEAYNSSLVREARYAQLTKNNLISNVVDLVRVLGNQDDITTYPIFSDSDSARVNTIVLGIFDLDLRVWVLWTNDPLRTPPLLQLPLNFTDLVWPALDEIIIPIPDVLPAMLSDTDKK
ncbi:Peptidase C45 [Cinara cedri]|uniref:Peptidase C45 n=1 Tax=Cinara cedri TaxID=506608 RepID=A0A5E4NFT9_9HEMI|nr:Peptidase C45 [Cinara cedri]